MNKKPPKVNTPRGEGEVKEVYISELGYLTIKVYYPDEKVFVSYNSGMYDIDNNPFNSLINKDGSDKK